MRRALNKRAALADESGLTIIEVLVASIVLVLGAAATFGILGAAAKNSQRARSTQVALDLAQEELERLHAIPYENLALSSMPSASTNELNPGYRVSGGQFAVERSPRGEYADLAIDSENGVSPESTFTAGASSEGGVGGTVYRYVVWRNDPTCSDKECEETTHDYKQIIVAVRPDAELGGERGYVEVQSQVTDPESIEPEGGEPGEEEDEENGVTGQQFYLTDTSCSTGTTTTRVEPTADHLLHNTLGTCASGLKTGNKEPGAPDVLLRTVPPDPAPENDAVPALYDYADDFYLEPTPDTDRGLQIRRDDTSGCNYEPTGATNPESQIHRWVTDKMTSAFVMQGKLTLEFYTRTLNDAIYQGVLCVYVFDRSESGSPPKATDTYLLDKSSGEPFWVYPPEGTGYWPRNLWTKVRLQMDLSAPHTIENTHRLGVALSVERAGTQGDAIPIMYDHPRYPTRLEVETSTPIEGG
jgi:hypothetical protein